MKRRRYLAGIATTTAGGALLSGCTSRSGGPGDGAGGDSPEPTVSGEDEVQALIDRAVSDLNTAVLEFAALREDVEGDGGVRLGSVSFPAERIRGAIGSAREHLDAAEPDATADQRRDVAALRDLASILAALTWLVARLADRVSQLRSLQQEIAAGDYEAARDTVEAFRTSEFGANARGKLRTATETAEGADADRLSALTSYDFAEVGAAVDLFGGAVSALLDLVSASGALLDGVVDLQAAKASAESGDFAAAEREAKDAREHFSTARTTLAGLSDVPAALQDEVSRASCVVDALVRGADYAVEGAAAGQDGDFQTARSRFQQASAQREKTRDC